MKLNTFRKLFPENPQVYMCQHLFQNNLFRNFPEMLSRVIKDGDNHSVTTAESNNCQKLKHSKGTFVIFQDQGMLVLISSVENKVVKSLN